MRIMFHVLELQDFIKMTDVHSKKNRSYNMSQIKNCDTKPELIVRKYLFHAGFRYRINVKVLPGKPDIVLRKYKTIIFIHGCFWHGHADCKYSHLPKSNIEFWKNKIEANKIHDTKVYNQLRKLGWHIIIIWECQLKLKMKDITLKGLVRTLNLIFLDNMKVLSK